MSKNAVKALQDIGIEFVRLSQQEADRLIYNLPAEQPGHTGNYRSNLMYKVDIASKTVYCGVDQSVYYAIFLENGTVNMEKRPVVAGTIQNNFAVWREIIENKLLERKNHH